MDDAVRPSATALGDCYAKGYRAPSRKRRRATIGPLSFWEAACFISTSSAHHGAEDLSRAAFAAALMLASASRIKSRISLPAPPVTTDYSGGKQPPRVPTKALLWGDDLHQLDRLLTLSCNNSIQSLLSSGAFAVLDSEPAKANLQVLTGTLMAQNPKLGFLWLGAALLGIHDFVLRWMRAVF
ncbi:hypothetical protein NKR19_g2826 [Coniochaeta hoffmannii]|uniref:Uncharacterized protein n=1 Tax=Coniochaeta hoffmannii TaxID=91930 RepID=A0AA38RVK4_9PEZI|nr:hypothetical protein NKR19_g2826 [Coniochaeta hoffmannii]